MPRIVERSLACGPTTASLRPARNGSTGGSTAAEAVEEKEYFDIKLTGFDAKAKIKVIKEVRALTGLGLKEAKEVVEGAPSVIKKEVKKEEAEEIMKKIIELGGTVELE